jgi:hypothetical protein
LGHRHTGGESQATIRCEFEHRHESLLEFAG